MARKCNSPHLRGAARPASRQQRARRGPVAAGAARRRATHTALLENLPACLLHFLFYGDFKKR